MNGKVEYDGLYLPNTDQPAVAHSNFKILIETTRDANLWIQMDDHNSAPLVFLQNGTILIPKDAYSEGLSKLEQWEQTQPK
jgi:hypothetical protein